MNQAFCRQTSSQLFRQAFRLTAIGVCIYCTPAHAIVLPPKYQLVILPPLPGDYSSFPESINNANVVAGFASPESSSSASQSVKWINGVPTEIVPASSGATAINDQGDVAGNIVGVVFSHGYLLKGSTLEDVRTPKLNSAGDYSVALDVNNSDQVVGWVSPGNGNPHSAFLWHDGIAVLLGTLGGPQSEAFAINNHGQVGGIAETPNLNDRAFIWSDANHNDLSDPGEMQQLPDMGLSSVVNGINDLGQATGWVLNSSFLRQPVVWNNATAFTLLPNPPSQSESEPMDISVNGDVVGTQHGRAILWHGGQVFDLNDLVTPVSGYSLLRATGINDNGWIVGQGLLGLADTGFMLIPVPEPSSIVIAVWFSILFGGSLRQRTLGL